MIRMTEQELVRKKTNPDLAYEVAGKPYIREDIEDDDSQLNPSITRENLTVVKGIGSIVAQRLHEANVISVSDLAHSTPEDLSVIKGIGNSTAQKMIEEAKSHLHTKKLNDFSDDPEPSIMEENTEEILVETQLKSEFNGFNEIIEEPKVILEPEIEVVEDNEQIADGYEEDEDLYGGLEDGDFEEENVHSELDVVKEDIDHVEPVDLESQIESQRVIPPTFATESFIEQEEEPTFAPEVHQGGEFIPLDEFHQLENKVRKRLEENRFYIIEKAAQLQDVTTKIDILAVKFVTDFNYGNKKSNGLTDLLLIIPIKLSNLKGPLIVSIDKVEYSATEEGSDFYIKRSPMSFINALTTAEKTIRTNLFEEASLFESLNKLFNYKFSLSKTFTRKNLYFYSGSTQYEVLIEPLIISQNEVGFTEKILPFAYHKNSNTHVVQLEQFSDFLEYIEKKYMLIESCTEKKSLLVLHSEAGDKLQKGLKFTLPFMSYALVYLVIFISQAYSLLSLVNNFGFGLIALMSILVGYLLLAYSKKVSEIKHEFSTPYNKRNLHLDEPSLRSINENLTSTLMEQFSYECLGKNPGFKIIEKVERENSQNFLQNKTLRKKVNETNLFEEEDTQEIENQSTSEVKNEYTRKYSSFLED